MRARSFGLLVLLVPAGCGSPGTEPYVRLRAPIVALTHVRVIDGTGTAGRDDQTIVVQDGRISAVTPADLARIPPEAEVLDLAGRTVFPGLVGMHEHLFYQMEVPSGTVAYAAQAAFAKLYLASGVTTIRTAGTVDFEGDRRLKALIDAGREVGPKIHLTGPYLSGAPGAPDPDRIVREVAAQADAGATSFKAYTTLRASELKAALQAAHDRGLRLTGHLCAVGFREAASLGIDNLEHGLIANTEFYSKKQPDVCPPQGEYLNELLYMQMTDAAMQRTIRELVGRGVSVTSTLAIIETFTARDVLDPRVPDILASGLRDEYHATSETRADPESARARMWSRALRKEMEFERMFVAAGGRLLAGADPTGWGGTMAGFADLRGLELLVEAGLTPEQAIKVATSNGAYFLNESDRIGIISAGKQADLVVVRGNPSVRISDVKAVDLVIKDGVGYDPAPLIAATEGSVGRFDPRSIVRWPYNILLCVLVLILAGRVAMRARRVT